MIALLGGAAARTRCRDPRPPRTPDYPWAVGETLTYSAKLGMLTLGSGTLRWRAIDTVRGTESSASGSGCRARRSFYSLDDVLESCVGTEIFESRRFVQDFIENDKPKHRRVRDLSRLRLLPRGRARHRPYATPADPLDDAAFFYFVRVTPLEVGKKYVYRPLLPEREEPGHHRGDEAREDGAARRQRGATAWCSTR